MSERYPNKRLLHRQGGRFAKAPTLDQMGFEVNDGPRRCSCGHVWSPLLATGTCPACGAQDSVPVPSPADGPVKLLSPRFLDPRHFHGWPREAEVLEDGLTVRVEGIQDQRFHLPAPMEAGTRLRVVLDRWFWATPLLPKPPEPAAGD